MMQLFQIYKERKFAVETNVSMDLTPMFVVLRDVLWLEDKDALWLANTQTTPSPVPTENIDIDGVIDDEKVNDLIKLGDKASYDDIYDVMNDMDIITADSHTANRDSYTLDKFSVENVRSALSTLFAFGNRYGIFLLVSTNTCKDLENVVMKEVKYKNLALNNYGIFGSFEEIKLSKEDTSAPADCAYITRFNSKVRLYDYDPVAYRSWWDDLQNKWKH